MRGHTGPRLHRCTTTFSNTVLVFLLVLLCWTPYDNVVEAWPYVDCSATNSIFALDRVTAHYDHGNNSIGLSLQGNFTDTYWAQGYSELATSKWRTSIQTTIMGTQLYRSEGPACANDGSGMIIGGCPTTPGLGTIQTSFNITQAAPFAELMVTMQIVGSNNQSIVCVAILLEQTMETVNIAVSILPLALACLSGTISLAATFMRASIGNGFLGAAATYGMATEPVSVHTPGFFDIIFYTQFMLMTGQLSVNYPSFYSSFTALFHWSFLEFRETLLGKGPTNATDVLTFGGAGSVNQIQDSRPGSNRGGSSILTPTITATAAAVVATTTESPPSLRKRDLSHEKEPRFIIDQDLLPLAWTTQAGSALRVAIVDPRVTPRVYIQPALPAKRQIQIDVGPDETTSVSHATPTVTDTVSVSASTSDTSTSTTTTTTSDSKSRTSSSTSSSSSTRTTSKSPVGPNPAVTRTSPSRPPASSTSPTLIIPTIRDAFTNTSESNIQHNVSRFGIEAYAAAIGAFPSSLFLGTLVNAALAMAAALLLSGGFLGIAWMMAREKHQRGKTLQHALNFVAGNMLRVWSLLYTPLALTAMYQLTISGGVALTVGSAASLLIISVGATIFFTWRILRGSSEHLLFDDLGTLLKYGPLYNTLAQEGTLFFLVTLLVRFLWGLAVAMLPSYGVAQVAVLLVIELGYTLVIGVKWPFSESTDNKFHLFLGIVRIVITGLSIGYIHEIEASPELRELLAYIQMALHLAVFIVMFAFTLWNLIQTCMFWHSRHSDTWRGPTKTYSFEDPSREVEQGWGLNGRPLLHSGAAHSRGVAVSNSDNRASGEGDDDDDSGAGKSRRFTVMSYSSLGNNSQGAGGGSSGARRESMQHALHAQQMRQLHHDSSDDETLRYGSPAERYRQSRLGDHHRPAFNQSASSETGSGPPDSGYMGPVLLSSAGVGSGLKGGATSPPSDTSTVDGRQSQLAMKRGGLPPRDSYASLQRMSHQQPSADPRTRRMSDIARDGPYLYNARKEEGNTSREAAAAAAAVIRESTSKSGSGPGLWAGVKASLAGVFRFGRRSNHSSPSSDGSKPKAFEVMRPPRRNFATDPESPTLGDHADETGSQAGGDARHLNSIGLSKFFQESDRGYEKNSNLVVANPSAMISRTGSLVSTVSGAVGPYASIRLQRDGSGATESIKTLRNARSRGAGVGSGLGPSAAVAAATAAAAAAASVAGSTKGSGLGIDTGSEHGGASVSISDWESRRASSALMSGAGSITGSQLYPPRHSAESSNNLAEAMTIEEPLQLDGGGTLKVSKGPEKAVQYFHKGSGPYSRSVAESLKDQKRLSKPEGLSATTVSPSSVSTPSLLLPPIQTRQLGDGSGAAAGKKVAAFSPSASSSPTTKSPTSAGGPSGLGDISSSSHDSNNVSLSGGIGSDESSPTESQPSPNANVAVSAGRMHEILGRMFSDRSIRLHPGAGGAGSDHDSDSVLSEDAHSSLSGGPVSTATGRRSLLGQTETTSHHDNDDTESIEEYDLLQPVMEGSDLENEDGGRYGVGEIDQDRTPRQSNFTLVTPSSASLVVPGVGSSGSGSDSGSRTELLKRATSLSAEKLPLLTTTAASSSHLARSQSGGPTSPTSPTGSSASKQHQQGKLRPQQRSIGGRPLAHSPLHEPSVLLRSATAGAAAANAAAGSASTGSGNSSPYLTSDPISVGGSDLSRQSSLQSGAGSPRLEYLDANWMHNEPSTGAVDRGGLNRNASIATVRSEASYVTAYSQYPSDDD
ncbi:hypothetical protein EC957_004852 [Mortierella hygrophila]|uniref:TRP C-terminal domain-containing protein n=1 Tax=Mortierella hygrophila TaxID=979708 RepID=A0A9P6JZZ3_9FUNG|nr:hypothetical protein EC957_004852 [Mortierella hygrophila]